MESPLLRLNADPSWTRLTSRGRDILGYHPKLSALLKAELGAETAGVLAIPVLEGEALEGWRSPFGGALVPADAKAEESIRKAMADVEALATRLEQKGEAGISAAQSLRLAMVAPDGHPAFYMDAETGTGVIASWGMAVPEQAERVMGLTYVETATSDGSAAAAAQAANNAAIAEASGRRPVRAFLLPWLVPAGLAGLVVWLAVLASNELPPRTVEVTPEAPAAMDPRFGLSDGLAELDLALKETEGAARRFGEVCALPPPEEIVVADPPVVEKRQSADPDVPDVTEPEPPVAEVEPEPVPEAEPETPPADPPAVVVDGPVEEPEEVVVIDRAPAEAPRPTVKKPAPPRVVQPVTPAPTREVPVEKEPEVAVLPNPTPTPAPSTGSNRPACRATWPAGRAPRMVFVVDGSGSMRDGISGARSRMDAAKRSIGGVVRGMHKDIKAAVVSFSDCGATRNSSYYSANERGRLIGQVNAMQPGRKTSLASSIRRAGALATRRSETTVVVVSDGEDTCGADPCAAARAIKSAKPNIKINVIDLSGGKARAVLSCVARAGGGRVYQPSSAGQMAAQVQRATGQPDASGC